MKYIDSEKLIAEIERRNLVNYCGSAEQYEDELLTIIDALQQEQPQVADASKMERLNVAILRDWSMKFAPDIRDAIKATAYHFWDLAICSMKEK